MYITYFQTNRLFLFLPLLLKLVADVFFFLLLLRTYVVFLSPLSGLFFVSDERREMLFTGTSVYVDLYVELSVSCSCFCLVVLDCCSCWCYYAQVWRLTHAAFCGEVLKILLSTERTQLKPWTLFTYHCCCVVFCYCCSTEPNRKPYLNAVLQLQVNDNQQTTNLWPKTCQRMHCLGLATRRDQPQQLDRVIGEGGRKCEQVTTTLNPEYT